MSVSWRCVFAYQIGDRAVLDQLLDEKVFQRDVFCPRGVGAIFVAR